MNPIKLRAQLKFKGRQPNSRPILPGKKVKSKRKCVSLETKVNALKMLALGKKSSDVAAAVGVDRTTVIHWAKEKDNITNQIGQTCPQNLKKTKKSRSCKHRGLNEAVWLWFCNMRDTNPQVPIGIEMVKIKAQAFHAELCDKNDFVASNGWYASWARFHGIRSLKCTGEKLAAPIEEVDPFVSKLMNIIRREDLQLSQVYNMDESALFYKCLPARSLASYKEKNVSSFKPLKNRLTITPCYNASGCHKIDLQIIGTAKNPRCFTNGRPKNVIYQNSAKAWQTKSLFGTWFFEHFIPQVKMFQEERGLNGHAILLLDNASAHEELQSEDGLIRTLLLPKNTTSVLQPADQNLILPLKTRYRKLLLKELIILGMDDPEEFLKRINVKQAIVMLTKCWKDLPQIILIKSWSKIFKNYGPYENLLKVMDEEWEEEDNLPLTQWKTRFQYDPVDWYSQDLEEVASLQLTDEEILLAVRGELNEIIEDPEEENYFEQDFTTDLDLSTYDVESSIEAPINEAEFEQRQALRMLTALEMFYQKQRDGEENEECIRRMKAELMKKIFE